MFNSNSPLVSVVIPVYGVEKFLRECLLSVLNQTYTNWECIIVNDSTPDNSMLIAQEFVNLDSRFRIINQENRGLAGARNTGIRNANGQYISLLDSDDVYLLNKLEKHIYHLQHNPLLGLSYSRSEFIDEDSNTLGLYQMPKLTDISPSLLLTSNPCGNGSAVVLRKQALNDIAYYDKTRQYICYFDEDLRQTEDVECWFRLISTTDWVMEGLPEPLTLYRVNNSGLSANLDKQFQSWELFISKAKAYAPITIHHSYSLAKAFQYRYLARRAIRSKDGSNALSYISKAFSSQPSLLLRDPIRTSLTLSAAILLNFLPSNFYSFIETNMIKLVGSRHKHIINRG